MFGDEFYCLMIYFFGKVKKKLNFKYVICVDKEIVVIEIFQEDFKNLDMKLDLGIKFKGFKQFYGQ